MTNRLIACFPLLCGLFLSQALLLSQATSTGGEDAVAVPTAAVSTEAEEALLAPLRAAAEVKWEEDIEKLEAKDKAVADPSDGILFIGSSSIRRWDEIATDMAPYRPIRRGYGGARFRDVAVYARRLITPHHYRAMAMFVANDVVGKPDDPSLDEVESWVRHIIGVSRAHQPLAPVLLIEVTPTQKRWPAWGKIRAVNTRLREIALASPHVYFVSTAGHYLRPDGRPRTEFFVEDQLHLNEAGYDVWGGLIRRRLDEVFRLMAETENAD